ncbi:nuclear GTPase SLIP-GC-like [Echeneis naucrates]|uniref:nuclear GTPase SLIP-GC-like n=1 Tax=Echeneis naucrates TaxID=173247 RepID=UPI0011142F89|nr:nuclear GTPase SLIP-GC-like [Echeneis naucrates]
MDEFVCNKLREWNFGELIQKFEEEEIDKESFYCLDDQEIKDLIPKAGPRLKFKKRLERLKAEQNATEDKMPDVSAHESEEAAESVQVGPSTSGTSDGGKRRLDVQGELTGSPQQSPAGKRRRDKKLPAYSEKIILADVKGIMEHVYRKLKNEEKTKLNNFLKAKIGDLETEKRELVGVFGQTGAGKSSLINAVIGVKNLLPSGDVRACTSVMIKVEANTKNSKFEAEIEFISKEDWKDELWYVDRILKDGAQKEEGDDYGGGDTGEKLTAVYGEEWKNMSPDDLMDKKWFKEIPEFLQNREEGKKILTFESARELSAKLVKYTKSDSTGQDGDIKRFYWPLIKCVTVRVPHNDLLQHVTLVDLPGNGDYNKSRDKMWKEIVGCCSTVWIVTEIKRAASDAEAWDILENASSLMGNGGECQQVHFICTKSDYSPEWEDKSAAEVRAAIFKRNREAKEAVMTNFRKKRKINKHFSEECFKVFTVSSKEFLKRKRLEPEDTEIPKLQEFLQELDDSHSDTVNYVFGALGIISLIHGARYSKVAGQTERVHTQLQTTLREELDKIRKALGEVYMDFKKCLTEGVEKSKDSCEKKLNSILFPRRASGSAFHKTLKYVVENNGTYKQKKRRQETMNEKLSSHLTDSIDEKFRKTFPNERQCEPFNGVIKAFSLQTERLIQQNKAVELQLTFLKTEEEKIKTKLNKLIRERKKMIYGSLVQTIEDCMKSCYEKAATFSGPGTLDNMRSTVECHVRGSKNIMFEQAKKVLLQNLKNLEGEILKMLNKTLTESVELSFKMDHSTIPDVSGEYDLVKKHYDMLKSSPEGEI